jgi:hypothetical protein
MGDRRWEEKGSRLEEPQQSNFYLGPVIYTCDEALIKTKLLLQQGLNGNFCSKNNQFGKHGSANEAAWLAADLLCMIECLARQAEHDGFIVL